MVRFFILFSFNCKTKLINILKQLVQLSSVSVLRKQLKANLLKRFRNSRTERGRYAYGLLIGILKN